MRSVLVDTNVLIYARDLDFPTKAARAKLWLTRLSAQNEAVISPQILNEFVSVSLKRFRSLPREEIYARACALMPWCHAPLDAAVTVEALRLHEEHGVAWWDSLIVASATNAGCRFVLSEDMQPGRRFGPVTLVNPFETEPEAILRAN